MDASKIDAATLAAIDAGVKEGQAEIDALAARLSVRTACSARARN